jgi:uncharacterized protein YycO
MIAAFKGLSPASRIIRSVNWGDYSHIAWVDDGTFECIESWGTGTRLIKSIHEQHTPGTPVDLFLVQGSTPAIEAKVRAFLLTQIGTSYDWLGILHFLTRKPEGQSGKAKWFCSELIFAAYQSAGINLLERVPPYKVYPSMLVMSPLLDPLDSSFTRYIINGDKK